jgi:GNAT superfamily N-acetyltransferase
MAFLFKMHELPVHSYSIAQSLFQNFPQAVLPAAILEGYNPGRIFVDQFDEPRVALIWSNVGYFFLAGEPSAVRDLAPVQKIIIETFIPASKKMGESGFILIPSNDHWIKYAGEILPDRNTRTIFRQPFRIHYDIFHAKREKIESNISLLELRKIDLDLIKMITLPPTWLSIDSFLKNGLGYVLMKGGEIISSCLSVFRSATGIEIDVHTIPEYRRKGYATITASALIEECIQKRLQPNWECFENNNASIDLAESLGFEKLSSYPVIYWEE